MTERHAHGLKRNGPLRSSALPFGATPGQPTALAMSAPRSLTGHRSITGRERPPNVAEIRCSAVSAEMVEHVSAGKVGEAAQSVIILALKEEVADQVHLIAAVSEGPRHGRQQ